MDDITDHSIDAERPYLLLILATTGFLGCLSLVLGTLIAPLFVSDYDRVADTISDLAAGEMEILMDIALYGFAAGLFAVALASAHAHLGGVGWSIGVLSLAVLGALVVVVGARNEYGDGDSDGVVIHIYLVYGLGVFFLLAPLCMASGFGRSHAWAKWTLLALAGVWAVATPAFFMLPTGIDGAFERFLGLVACSLVCTMSWVFFKRGLDAAKH
ncbi:DUF998 domain-containing protein [Botrimarina sp.]|uniref:DUF998 domain-containing protein n=1 Tax=Botrimarina sp. TaxID=2795802 RepID=UPI0032ECD76A